VPNTTGHLSADLRNPFLNVTYTSQPDIEPEIIEEITQVEEQIKKDLKEVKIEDSKPVESMQETQVQSIDQTKEDKQEVQQTNAAPTSQSESPKEQQSQTEQKEKQAETESSQSTEKSESQSEASQETASANQTNVSSLDADMKEIDQNVKKIGQNIQMKNKVLHTRMVDNSLLDSYNNVRFYKDFKIYEDQIKIADNRIIYSANLNTYKDKDPIFIKQKNLYEIKLQKLKLLNEIEVLKNG
jgi:chemotaxis protein histidine kinase CheA